VELNSDGISSGNGNNLARVQKTQSEDKPDMIEANTTHLWQMQSSVDAQILCASVPASPFRTQSEFGLAWANEMSARKQDSKTASKTARLRLTLRRPVVSHSRHKSADLALTPKLSRSCIKDASSRPDFRSADSFNYIHADMGISVPVPAFFVFEQHIPAIDFSID